MFLRHNKLTIVYVLYVVACLLCNYAVGELRGIALADNHSFLATPIAIADIILFFPLGFLWAAEAFWATRANWQTVLIVRVITIFALGFICMSPLVKVHSVLFFNGMGRACAMEAGLLLYRIIVSKRKEQRGVQ